MTVSKSESIILGDSDVKGDNEQINIGLAVAVFAALVVLFAVAGALILRVYFTVPTPRTALERELVVYQQQVEQNPNNAYARVNLGRIYHRLGRTDSAIDELRRAQRIEPTLWDAPFQLGLIYLDQKQKAAAIRHFEQAKEADPANELSYHQLGAIYLEEKRYKLAIENLSQAVKLKPIVADTHLSLGKAHEGLDNRVEAANHYREALKYIPDMAEAKEALDRVSK